MAGHAALGRNGRPGHVGATPLDTHRAASARLTRPVGARLARQGRPGPAPRMRRAWEIQIRPRHAARWTRLANQGIPGRARSAPRMRRAWEIPARPPHVGRRTRLAWHPHASRGTPRKGGPCLVSAPHAPGPGGPSPTTSRGPPDTPSAASAPLTRPRRDAPHKARRPAPRMGRAWDVQVRPPPRRAAGHLARHQHALTRPRRDTPRKAEPRLVSAPHAPSLGNPSPTTSRGPVGTRLARQSRAWSAPRVDRAWEVQARPRHAASGSGGCSVVGRGSVFSFAARAARCASLAAWRAASPWRRRSSKAARSAARAVRRARSSSTRSAAVMAPPTGHGRKVGWSTAHNQ